MAALRARVAPPREDPAERSRNHRDATAQYPAGSPRPESQSGPGRGGSRAGGRWLGGDGAGAGRRIETAPAPGHGRRQGGPRRGGGGPALLVPEWRNAEARWAVPRRRKRRGGVRRRRRRRVGPWLGRGPPRRDPEADALPRRDGPSARSALGRRGALRSEVSTEPARRGGGPVSGSLISAGVRRICRAYQERRPLTRARRASDVARGFPPADHPPPSPGEGTDRR